jgi:ribosomal protein L11 methyltransferase
MKYIKLVIGVQDEYQETLISELLELEFDAFEQLHGKIITYVPKERFSDVNREQIEAILRAYPGDGFIESEEVVADQNWNEQWEQTIQPQSIGRFYVKPTWSAKQTPAGLTLLEIDPKMSFGTGYHETTRLMLRFLPDLITKEDHVLDVGTGTGILAIAAVKLGARKAVAIDIDEWSITNTRENILLNKVDRKIDVLLGGTEVIPTDEKFDLVMANIQKNTILSMIPTLVEAGFRNASLLLSGLLNKDRDAVVRKALEHELKLQEVRKENEWIALHLKR